MASHRQDSYTRSQELTLGIKRKGFNEPYRRLGFWNLR